MAPAKNHYQAFVRLRSPVTGEWLVDKRLRGKLVKDAEKEGSNLTDTILAILCERYGVECAPNGRRTAPASDGEELNLRLPLPLYDRIAQACVGRHPWSVADEIRAALSAHYNFPEPAPARSRRAA